jgi:hypothetical protein
MDACWLSMMAPLSSVDDANILAILRRRAACVQMWSVLFISNINSCKWQRITEGTPR